MICSSIYTINEKNLEPFCNSYYYACFESHTARSEEGGADQQSIVAPVVGSIFGVGLLLTISITAAIW